MLPPISQARLLDLLRQALLVRRFEEALIELSQLHDIGHFHVYIGQEMTGVTALALLRVDDVVYTTHRNHGHLLARGVSPGAMMAEILGRRDGTNRGKGGTLHLASRSHGLPHTSSSVGGPLPIAVGSGIAFQELGRDSISVCVFGDGALEEGAWHEAVNVAALRHAPVVFLCENNSLEALGQKANEYPSSTLAARELTDLPRAFGVTSWAVDGSDVRAVHIAMRRAVTRARGGKGPSFIEARTVRWPGSRSIWPTLITGVTNLSLAWDNQVASRERASWFVSHDGVIRFIRELLVAGICTPTDVMAMDQAACSEIGAAKTFALESPFPAAEEAVENVYE